MCVHAHLTYCTIQRSKEIWTKFEESLEQVLGDRRDEMAYIWGLATSPASQGRGYGTALVKTITDMVRDVNEQSDSRAVLLTTFVHSEQTDELGRSTFLFSSNINNTSFYNSCGFKVVGEILIGQDNPTWVRKPVVVCLVSDSSSIDTE